MIHEVAELAREPRDTCCILRLREGPKKGFRVGSCNTHLKLTHSNIMTSSHFSKNRAEETFVLDST